MSRLAICSLFLAFSCIPFAFGQDSQTNSKDLPALLAANRSNDQLDSPGGKPWRMKASYQLYDAQEKPAGSGTYEYDWATPGKSRMLWNRGNTTITLWSLPGSPDLVSGNIDQLRPVELDIRGLTSGVLPSPQVLAQYDLSLHPISFGQSALRCVILAPRKNLPAQNPAAFSGYCFDQEKPQLRLMTIQSASLTLVLLDNPVLFHGAWIPRNLLMLRGGKKIFSLDITELNDSSDSPGAFTPLSAARPLHLLYAAAQVKDMVESSPHYTYPQKVREFNLFGHVMLTAHVGKDGRTESVRVDSGVRILREEAQKDVSQLTYRPLFLAGSPVDFDVAFDVNFTEDHQMQLIEPNSNGSLHPQCGHAILTGALCVASPIEEAP